MTDTTELFTKSRHLDGSDNRSTAKAGNAYEFLKVRENVMEGRNKTPRFMREYANHINKDINKYNTSDKLEKLSKVYSIVSAYERGYITVTEAMRELSNI